VALFGLAILSGFLAPDSYPSLFAVGVHNILFAHIDNVRALLLVAILGHPVGDRRCVGFTPRYSHSPPPFKVLFPDAGKYECPKNKLKRQKTRAGEKHPTRIGCALSVSWVVSVSISKSAFSCE
jgi:hypothetical protein